jgi:putative DNA primase/helicase
MYSSNLDSQSPQQPLKPTAPTVKADAIPAELKATKRWVVWRFEYRTNANGSGRWTKVPINPRTFGNARSNDPDTWVLFDAAFTASADAVNNLDGVGFMLGDGWAGIDIDNCFDADQNFIINAAPEIIKNLDTYTEISPSGRGIKMLFQANTGKGRKFGGLECYSQGRFFTITGHHLHGTPAAPQPRQKQADEFLAVYFDDDTEPAVVDYSHYTPHPVTDKRLKDSLERACLRPYGEAFRRLWRGEWQGLDYPSQSEADCALLNYLAYELGPDPQAIDALFRQSGLMRPKWDSRRGSSTWGQQRIDFALAGLNK